MDSRDSSGPPPHYPQRPPTAALFGQHAQHQLHNAYPLHNNVVASTMSPSVTHQQQNPRFLFNPVATAPEPKPVELQYSDGSPSGEPMRKRRGRPRKYSSDSIGLGLSSVAVNQVSSTVGSGGGDGAPSSQPAAKRGRGRPPGSVKRQMDALGVPGVGFTPHVITVDVGEDIASKIMEFSQQGPRTVCILSANGSISNVTLRQSTLSGGTVTYEGRFEIISLTGSFKLSDDTSNGILLGSLHVSLAGSDGRVLGGGVAGTLKAAASVQIVVGSFVVDAKKTKSILSSPPSSNALNFNAPVAGAILSPGASSESAEENDESPLNLDSEPYGNTSQSIPNLHMYSPMGWPNTFKMHPS